MTALGQRNHPARSTFRPLLWFPVTSETKRLVEKNSVLCQFGHSRPQSLLEISQLEYILGWDKYLFPSATEGKPKTSNFQVAEQGRIPAISTIMLLITWVREFPPSILLSGPR